MFVRMSHWNCRAECWGEDRSLFESGAVPIMQRQPGFVRAMLLGRPGTVHRIAFTVWKSESAYRDFVASADLQVITDMFAHMYIEGAVPEPVEYEIRAHGAAHAS